MAVHVSNIPLAADEDDLKKVLEEAVGKRSVLYCNIAAQTYNTKSRGFGTVDFTNQEMADLAIKLASKKNLKLHNRVLILKSQTRRAMPWVGHITSYSIATASLSIGCLTSEDTVHSMWYHRGALTIDVNSEKQILAVSSIRLGKSEDVWGMEYKMDFGFDDIAELRAIQTNGHDGFLLQVKERPPTLYCRRPQEPHVATGDPYVNMVEGFLGRNLKQYNQDGQWTWIRTTDFTGAAVIGQSFSYVVEYSGSHCESVAALLDGTAFYKDTPIHVRLEKGVAYADNQSVVPLWNPSQCLLPFEQLFKINNLIQKGKLCGPNLNVESRFVKLIRDSPPAEVSIALQAMASETAICFDPVNYLKEHFDKQRSGSRPAGGELEKGTAFIPRVLVTPTKVFCVGPEPEKSNRIVRIYGKDGEFLRVNFVDEHFGPLESQALVSESGTSRSSLYKRIKDVLKQGISIGSHHFQFLAFSASQLRDGQVWMYARPEREKLTAASVDTIRNSMGDFAGIRNVAKCAARMGQCFSSSTETRKVLPIQVKRIKDIECKAGLITYCFSDGIGKISDAFARTIAADCGMPNGRVPSAFQIRYRGYKGVVARDPRARSTFKLYLRPSMHKFDSPHLSLEILEWTKPLSFHLNRQIISLLSTLGVCDSAFLDLQNEVISKYERMMVDDKAALCILQEQSKHSIVHSMLMAGYASTSEPFLKRMLCAFRQAQLYELKSKAKIPVAKGRVMMGCLDETGILEYGQVYVKYTEMGSSGRDMGREIVVTTKVFVAKNPCLHPGDVRLLQAVDVTELGHMVDCVVFPQRGPRPHPNECSGSDLDGDMYHVSWDETLLPTKSHAPMDYSAPPPALLDHQVQIEDIQDFFVNYMVNDNLGVIANAHVVHADREADKACSQHCLELAHLASMAVDFPKTGIPAVIPPELRPREYPDFMEKGDLKSTYTSTGVLGKLYRAIVSNPIGSSSTGICTEDDLKKSYDLDLRVPGFEEYVESAYLHKSMYDVKLMAIMSNFGIRDEAEIVSGHVVFLSQQYQRKRFDTLPKIELAFKVLVDEAKTWFRENKRMSEDEENTKASAWYYAAYHVKSFRRLNSSIYSPAARRKVHLLSFPWVMSHILLRVKRRAISQTAAQDGRNGRRLSGELSTPENFERPRKRVTAW